jgi:hypothetical protein
MSGHNKWSKIKHQKGASDVKRGNLYTKLSREIIIATREGGGDPDGNFRLRLAIQKARDSNMPMATGPAARLSWLTASRITATAPYRKYAAPLPGMEAPWQKAGASAGCLTPKESFPSMRPMWTRMN